MRFLRAIEEGKTRKDRIINATFRENRRINKSLKITIQENQLRWYGHITRMKVDGGGRKIRD